MIAVRNDHLPSVLRDIVNAATPEVLLPVGTARCALCKGDGKLGGGDVRDCRCPVCAGSGLQLLAALPS